MLAEKTNNIFMHNGELSGSKAGWRGYFASINL